MPAKSRAQQRLMQAAEHGATFPMAQKIRQSMTHQQMHDFAVGSEKNKPERVLHPALAERSRLVKEAHQHLSATVPEYNRAPAKQRMMMTQEHIRTRKANGW